MFTAAKLVAATAVVALFGGFLLAGVIDAPEGKVVPGASSVEQTPEVSMDVARVAGQVHYQRGQEPTMEVDEDRTMYRGAREPITLDVADPRLDASGTLALDHDTLAAEPAQEIHSGRWALENDSGSWVGEMRGYQDAGGRSVVTMQGGGGYEGLSAVLFLSGEADAAYDEVIGVVFPGGMPPRPGPAQASPKFDPAAADPIGDTSAATGSVDGVMYIWNGAEAPTHDGAFTERMRYKDGWSYSELEANDPRISGAYSVVSIRDTFIGALGETVWSASVRIDNAGGAWAGPSIGYSDDIGHSYQLLDGSGAYEGLQAMLFEEFDKLTVRVWGLVFPAPVPDLPETPATAP